MEPGGSVDLSQINEISRKNVSRKFSKLNVHGFTILELLVSVAVVYILVSLAAHNQEINRRKSLRAEAKLGLSSLYSLEKAFYSEYSAYIPSLDAIGYSNEGYRRYYKTGWRTTAGDYTHTITGYTGAVTTQHYIPTNNSGIGNNCSPLIDANSAPFDVDNPQTLIASSTGLLFHGVDPTNCDGWSIDESKNISNYKNGLY